MYVFMILFPGIFNYNLKQTHPYNVCYSFFLAFNLMHGK